jgi:hypothetical protein
MLTSFIALHGVSGGAPAKQHYKQHLRWRFDLSQVNVDLLSGLAAWLQRPSSRWHATDAVPVS